MLLIIINVMNKKIILFFILFLVFLISFYFFYIKINNDNKILVLSWVKQKNISSKLEVKNDIDINYTNYSIDKVKNNSVLLVNAKAPYLFFFGFQFFSMKWGVKWILSKKFLKN